jgi:hypothetical protein
VVVVVVVVYCGTNAEYAAGVIADERSVDLESAEESVAADVVKAETVTMPPVRRLNIGQYLRRGKMAVFRACW